MKNKPLFSQLFFTQILLFLSGLLLLVFLVNKFIRDLYYSDTKKDLGDHAQLIGYFIKKNQQLDSLQTFVEEFVNRTKMRVTIISLDGIVLGDSHENPLEMDNHGKRPEIIDAFNEGQGTSIRYSKTLNEVLMYYCIIINNKKTDLAIRVSVPMTYLETNIKRLQNNIFIIGLIIVLILSLISFYLIKRITLPLENMRIAAKRFSNEDFSEPIKVSKQLELASMAKSLNAMASNLNNRIMTITNERNEREAILSCMREGVIAINKNREIFSLNYAACEYLRIDKDNALNRKIDGLLRDFELLEFINDLLKSKETKEEEIKIKRREDTFFLVSGNYIKMNDQISGVLIVMNNITRQKQLEKMRQEFVANVSHELKTPITSIIGYMEIIKNKQATKEQIQSFIRKVIDQSRRLNLIISDLLKLSKIESQENNDLELIKQPLFPILDSAIEDIKYTYPDYNLVFTLDCNSKIEFKADAQLLREAIVNLLDNAVKYGDKDHEIKIGASVANKLRINIHNRGNPIPKELRNKIFHRFYRIDKSRSREAGGTGLGLAIVKHIVIAHGGVITVKSSELKGTTFSINFLL